VIVPSNHPAQPVKPFGALQPVRALADALGRRGIAPERFVVPAFGETRMFATAA